MTVTFQNQPSGHNTGFMDTAGMLDPALDFEAIQELTNGTVTAASARRMVMDGAYVYWMQGEVATSIILADHSAERRYDIGFDTHRSFRPIFHATFWPAIGKVRVRFIGEISNTESLQDQRYALALKTGFANPQTVYTKPVFTHTAMSRWTKEFWIGGAPSEVAIEPGLAYLAATRFLCNYDTTKRIPEYVMAQEYASWTRAARDLYDAGNWTKAMGTAGGRPDIGPYPSWIVRWLYTGDERMRAKAFGNADLAAAWPIHLREGNQDKYLDRGHTVPGIGRILAISDRPSFTNFNLTYAYTRQEDRVTPVGPYTTGGWQPDVAHAPEPWSPLYALTGDYWYLEQLWFWTSWMDAYPNGAAVNYGYGRGPTGAEGGLTNGQVRGAAWHLRTRVNAAFVSPDNAPEKAYFERLIDDAITIEEGARDIHGTAFEGDANWTWGNRLRMARGGPPPLHQWSRGATAFAQEGYGIDPTVTEEASSNFEQHFMMFALGRARELGYSVDALASYLAVNVIGQLTNPAYNPYLLANGRLPSVRVRDHEYFDTWADLKTGYKPEWQSQTSFRLSDPEHGYEFLGLAAASMVANDEGGDAAWAFMEAQALPAPVLDGNPKWAILPR